MDIHIDSSDVERGRGGGQGEKQGMTTLRASNKRKYANAGPVITYAYTYTHTSFIKMGKHTHCI